jgi:Ser/Thr protein kinase RdoA (MazF antagonist)
MPDPELLEFQKNAFYTLGPSEILNSIEEALDVSHNPKRRCSGRLMALNSIENRVYSFDLEDGTEWVVKFYRPHRWNLDQIHEEHEFLRRLEEREVPIIRPLDLPVSKVHNRSISATDKGIYFTIFPKVRGRLRDEIFSEDIPILGRLLARLHAVGKGFEVRHRLHFSMGAWGWDSLNELDESPHAQSPMAERYLDLVENALQAMTPLIESLDQQAIHGDCHCGNILWNEHGPYFTDFDDFVVGPPVQDLWMIFRGRGLEEDKRRDDFLRAYEEFRPFPRDSLKAIESLRALRMLHYSAWIARRWEDPSFRLLFPNFGTEEWWREEYEALYETLESSAF